MGLRIKKVIGYGVQGLNREGDPRIDWAKFRAFVDREETARDFLGFIEAGKADDIMHKLLLKEKPNNKEDNKYVESIDFKLMRRLVKDREEKGVHAMFTSPSNYVHYCDEAGKPDVMVLQAPFSDDWSRRDDIIDYCEEGPESRVRLLDSTGIYPYAGTMVRIRLPSQEVAGALSATGRLKGGSMEGGWYNQLVGRWCKTQPPLVEGELLEHLLNDWRAPIPSGILALMVFMDCFPNLGEEGSILDDMRPMLYVYWM